MASNPQQPPKNPYASPGAPPPKSKSGLIVLLIVCAIFGGMCLCCGPALLLPAIQAARESARRM